MKTCLVVLVGEMTEGAVIKSIGFAVTAKGTGDAATIESVADILERELQHVIEDWLSRIEQEPDLMRIPMNTEDRTGHLPRLLHDVLRGCVWEQARKLRFRRLRPTTEICGVSKATR